MDEPQFRRNVAAILRDGNGRILVAERADVPGAWQFPQGGVDDGESDEEALLREVREELGIRPGLLRVLTRREGYRYLFPPGRVKNGRYHGQEQVYFLCDFLGGDEDIDLDAHQREFARFRWIAPQDFDPEWVPDFKKAVYAAVLRDFFDADDEPAA